MRVVDAMMGTPYYCQPNSNLGSVTELMWKGNCGFLPVVGVTGKIVGVLTDRDICIALGTRGRAAGEVRAAEVMSKNVRYCEPEDDVHSALLIMGENRVRRLPVVNREGTLVGVISVDDILLRTSNGAGSVSSEEIVNAFRSINEHDLSLVTCNQATT